MAIYASRRAWEVLQKPDVLESINGSNRYAANACGFTRAYAEHDLDWRPGITGETVGDGDCIDLGDVKVQILETPGHAPCCLSAYVPAKGVLFPSEAAGIPFKDKILPYGTSNFVHFESSLLKLKDLRADYVCSDHWGYLTGDEARAFIANTISETQRRRALMHEAYRRAGSVDDAARELARHFKDENLTNMLPAEKFEDSFRNMVKYVVGLKS
jgi:glyoxylase-like metal-dependent hydrolase (beta-lactamase superfamily II)